MLRRLQTSNLNLLVLGTSAAIFVIAFLVLQGLATARIPQSTTILAAARTLQIGDQIQQGDLVEKAIFVDEMTASYVRADSALDLVGAYAALPVRAGQPLLRENFISPDASGERFSAFLTQFPGHSLFPLPIDAVNVVAPPIEMYRSGDLVGLTVAISSRPPQQATQAPDVFSYTLPGPAPAELPEVLPEPDTTTDESVERGYPPLAKDLFPGGVRVAGVHGLPESARPDDETSAFSAYEQEEILILLLPDSGRERLSLALLQGDRVFVSLLSHSNPTGPTTGFTYWDLEDWFREDRSVDPQR